MDLICRTCLVYNDELEPLYTKKLVDTDYEDITTMIYLCTGLEISEDDQLSDTICTQCIDSIINAFKFREKAWESNNVLLKASKVLASAQDSCYTKSDENNTNIFVAPLASNIEFKLENCEVELSNLKTLEAEYLSFEPYFEDENECDPQSELECDLSEATGEQTYIDLGPDEKNLSLEQLGIEKPDYQKIFKDFHKYIQIADKSITSRPYCCTKCNQTYEVAGPLYKHLLAHHNIRVLTVFRCKACLKTFIKESHIRKHLNNAHQPNPLTQNFVCDLCGKSFKHNSNLIIHLNRHNGIKPFHCDLCQFRAVSNTELKLHLRSHTNERPFICNICNMGFRCSGHRSAHIKEAHSDNPHECKICGIEFTSWRNYKRHMQHHNSNMNLKCDICQKKFIHRRYLKLHMRHHGEKMFKCSVCEKAFHQKQNCKNHMKKAHNSIL